ncbi:MAG: tRNA (adenosine(37)-N6)-dimethylallyltransferase MiaA [Candidatus Eisenbacteria bacterium]|nr:tRNA (adenosine(37)-N6)-dimethylallyltransferase MiaA [Candidatus Eisenbacteria bacterium]
MFSTPSCPTAIPTGVPPTSSCGWKTLTAASSDPDAAARVRRIPFLVGPTACGKTDVALELNRRTGRTLLSIDARQVYRGLDAATGKPESKEERRLHRLIDIWEPTERGSAGRFARRFYEEVERLGEGGCLAVGGSGLYLDAVLGRIDPMPPVDPRLRGALQREWDARGGATLYEELQRLDPETAARLAPRDRQRILRALEVVRQTGRPLSAWQTSGHGPLDVSGGPPIIVLLRDRNDLRRRIEARCRAMAAGGLEEEIRALLDRGVPEDAPGFKTLGYAEWLPVFQGRADRVETMERFIVNTWHYARRQMTWFRNRYTGTREIVLDPDTTPQAAADRAQEVWARPTNERR